MTWLLLMNFPVSLSSLKTIWRLRLCLRRKETDLELISTSTKVKTNLRTSTKSLSPSTEIKDEKLERIEATSATKTEQQATERDLRIKRNQIIAIVKDLSAKKHLDEFKTKDKAAKKTEESKPPTEIKIPVTELTKMQVTEVKKPEYYRNAVIARAYKTNIKTIHDEIEDLMKVHSSQLKNNREMKDNW